MTEDSDTETRRCDNCGEEVMPIVKKVDLWSIGTYNYDFCPSCDRPVDDSSSFHEGEVETAEVSDVPHEEGIVDYPSRGAF